jgi:tRNA wybutosine-synthesizing protein 2
MMEASGISLIVPKKYVKTAKTALEEHKKLDRNRKIRHYYGDPSVSDRMLVPTTFQPSLLNDLSKQQRVLTILALLNLETLAECVSIYGALRDNSNEQIQSVGGNPFISAVRKSILSLPPEILQSIGVTVESLLRALPTSYSLYSPLLLLQKSTFTGSQWEALFSTATEEQKQNIFKLIANSMNVTHIATNAPIPRLETQQEGELKATSENILRSPVHLSPLFGDFGPVVTSSNPTREDFNAAFWVSTRQNGITQVWAPRYTMFSRGNITEKARVLNLSSVTGAVDQGISDGRSSAAVDLYAGIGYFAFSYAKAGIKKIYCWELNPWSIEGFRRGAEENKWSVFITDQDMSFDHDSLGDDSSIFVVFSMDNRKSTAIIERSRVALPPIRHVNCGLLPTSKGSWETAVRILDYELGGWVHLHENIATKDIESRSESILEQIQQLIDTSATTSNEDRGKRRLAVLQHVETVKTYAPGVMHCVLDIYISNHVIKS